jgi:LPXTG-motif cell wall-anchored protein
VNVTRFRRTAAAVAGALIGASVFVAPANAGEPPPSAELAASPACTDAGWTITWKLTTTGTNGVDGVFSDFSLGLGSPYPKGPPPPENLRFFVQNGKATGDGVFTEDWSLGRYFNWVQLRFTVTWHNGANIYTKVVAADARTPAECAVPYTPPPTPTSSATSTPTPATSTPNSPAAQPAASATPLLAADAGLPVTGTAVGAVAGIAAVLLTAGSLLFVLFRRRRVKFTA